MIGLELPPEVLALAEPARRRGVVVGELFGPKLVFVRGDEVAGLKLPNGGFGLADGLPPGRGLAGSVFTAEGGGILSLGRLTGSYDAGAKETFLVLVVSVVGVSLVLMAIAGTMAGDLSLMSIISTD
jgi:hypothetical protein